MAPLKPRSPRWSTKPKTVKPNVKDSKEETKKRGKTKPVTSFDKMLLWPQTLRDFVYGLHPKASELDYHKAEYAFIKSGGKFYCRRCSKCLCSSITVIKKHVSSKACEGADKSKLFTGVFLPSKQNIMRPVDINALRGYVSSILLSSGISRSFCSTRPRTFFELCICWPLMAWARTRRSLRTFVPLWSAWRASFSSL